MTRFQQHLDYEQKDYYAVLGLPGSACTAQVRKKYRQLALQWHPDKHPDGKKTIVAENFRQIAEAYEVLVDENSKAEHNEIWRPCVMRRSQSLRRNLSRSTNLQRETNFQDPAICMELSSSTTRFQQCVRNFSICFRARGVGVLALWLLLIVGSSRSKIIFVFAALQKYLYRWRNPSAF